jgi:diguanylate cyclase (GGDEF)-like protein
LATKPRLDQHVLAFLRLARELPERSVSIEVMAHSGAYLYGSGALLVIATLALPHGEVRWVGGVLSVTLVALTAATALYFVGHRLPRWFFHLISPFGSLMVASVMFWGGGYGLAYSMLFVWAALYSFSFFSPRAATIQALTIAILAGLYMFVAVDSPFSPGYWLMITGTGAVAGVLIQRQIRQVEALANVDALTGANNRRTWDTEVPRAIQRAGRTHRPMVVAIADIDHFKVFNDEHGHQAGDSLLRDVVTIWRTMLRGGDTLARYGGEEFGITLEGCDVIAAMQAAEKLRVAMPLGSTCSVGVAQWDGSESPQALVARADAALYEAKRMGRNRVVAAPMRTANVEGDLADTARWAEVVYAMVSRRDPSEAPPIRAAYQPIVRLWDGTIVGFEALARPTEALAGMSVEGLFSAAQRMGLTRDVDWICRRAAVRDATGLAPGIPLFINISIASLLDPIHNVDQMLLLLNSVRRSPADVVLELTERETVVDRERLSDVLGQYRAEGFRFAIDDLGEGRSAMEVLAAAVPEFIKVARVLVRDESVGSRSLLAAAVAFGRNSGAEVIAEGIETADDVERITRAGIRLGQGYHLGRPSFELPAVDARGLSDPVADAPHLVVDAG